MDSYIESFRLWRDSSFFDEATRKELSLLDEERDAKEIEDRFYRSLEFGTGGLRGVMGAGTNRMNIYTVAKATEGLANYLISVFGKALCREKGVSIGFDTRNNSKIFAQTAANVLSSNGIKVYLHDSARPTPQLSFSVRYFGTLSGIVVTASHNPKEYNGYKVYDENGCQAVPEVAQRILEHIEAVDDITTIKMEGEPSLIERVDTTSEFVDAVLMQRRFFGTPSVKIVYTPLHGTGRVPVAAALEKCGFDVNVVSEQADENGDFPTVVSPNPEDRRALSIGIEKAKAICADIVLGTDPDCDRVGVAVREKDGEYTLLTGNQTGALLVDYIVSNTDMASIKRPAVIKTVVTNELGALIAKKHGASVFSTLTGFKYIGEKICQFEKAAEENDTSREYTYLFGYEESYGYLAGTHARDKDAAVSALLICEMAESLKKRGLSLTERLGELYSEYGYFLDHLESFTLKGKDGIEKINSMMQKLRENGSPFENTEKTEDLIKGLPAEEGFGMLPAADVLKYTLCDGSWIAVRPSGTEPKIKIYYSIQAENKTQAESRLEQAVKTVKKALDL